MHEHRCSEVLACRYGTVATSYSCVGESAVSQGAHRLCLSAPGTLQCADFEGTSD